MTKHWRIATYSFLAALVVSSVGAVPTHAAPICVSDQQGANDQPGQKDLTGFCSGAPTEIAQCSGDFSATWNWDDTGLSGGNTGDACGLFDTDDDGNANYAICVTISGTTAGQSGVSPRVYSCGNTRPDRCTSPIVPITSFASTCAVVNPATSPFSTNSNGKCNGASCGQKDTQARCCIELNDFASSGAAVLLDTCSYPSQQPNSDPSDCIVTKQCATDDDCRTNQTCRLDQCGTDGICRHPVDVDGPCNDGNACTTGDTCNPDGTCGAGDPTTCPAPDQCHNPGQCNMTSGQCEYTAKSGSCSDGDPCTINDTCTNGSCAGSPLVCTPLDQCHVAGVCSGGACSNPNANNNTPCSDGNSCTTGDSCQAGTCTGAPVVCTALDQCHTAGTCSGGVCSNPPKANTSPCHADGNACTVDTCQNGVCTTTGTANIPES